MSETIDARIRISVYPEATDEEMAAIAAAVTTLLSIAPDEVAPREDRWGRMGRYEAMHGPFWPPDPEG